MAFLSDLTHLDHWRVTFWLEFVMFQGRFHPNSVLLRTNPDQMTLEIATTHETHLLAESSVLFLCFCEINVLMHNFIAFFVTL